MSSRDAKMSVIQSSKRTYRMLYFAETVDFKSVYLKDSLAWTGFQEIIASEPAGGYAPFLETHLKANNTITDHSGGESSNTQRLAPTNLSDFQAKLSALRYHSFVLNDNSKPLDEFKNVKELLQVFHDAIQAHHNAIHLANVLHRDVSPMTIMIGSKGHGILVDWDLCKPDGNQHPRYLERMGTWQFMAYRLVEARMSSDLFPEHDENDDLESFWFVLYWLAIRHCEHMSPNDTISAELKRVFDGSFLNEGTPAADISKIGVLMNVAHIDKLSFLSSPLAKILKEYQCVISLRYKLKPAEIEHINKIWMQVQKDHSTFSEEQQIVQLIITLVGSGIPYRSIFPDARLLSVKGWAQHMFANVLNNEPPSSWKIGAKNSPRDLPDISENWQDEGQE